MKFEQLCYYVETCKAKSVSKAATGLFISQQGLNKALSSMEAELGCMLLSRSHKGVEPTRAGQVFYDYAVRVLEDFDATLAAIGANIPAGIQELSSCIEAKVTPYCMSALSSELAHPCVASVLETGLSEATSYLKDGSAEFAVLDVFAVRGSETLHHALGLDAAAFEAVPVFDTVLGILCDASSTFARKGSVTVDELLAMRIALIRDDTLREAFKRIAGGRSFAAVALETTDRTSFLAHVNSKKTPSLLDSYAFWELQKKGLVGDGISFVPIETPLEDTVCLVYAKDAPSAALFERYASYVKKSFGGRHPGYGVHK